MGITSRLRLRDKRVTGAAWMTVAAGISAFVALLSVPFITRIYEPATFGAFAFVLAFLGTLSAVSTGRYEMLCVVAPHTPEGEAEAGQAARLSARIALVAALLLATAMALWVLVFHRDLGGAAGLALFLLPLMLFTSGLGTIQTLMDNRRAYYRLMASLTVMKAVLVPLGQIGFGLINPSLISLLLPSVLLSVVTVGRFVYLIRRTPAPDRSYREFAKEHRRYPVFQVPAAIANGLSTNIFVFALTAAYSTATVGIFSLATRLSGIPSALFGGPMNTVYFREAARIAEDRQRARQLYLKTLGAVIGLALLAYAALIAAMPVLLKVLGPEWQQTPAMVIATIPLSLAGMLSAPPNSALIVYGRQGVLLVWRLVLIAAPPAAIIAGAQLGWPDTTSVLVAGLLLVTGVALYALWGLRLIKGSRVADVDS